MHLLLLVVLWSLAAPVIAGCALLAVIFLATALFCMGVFVLAALGRLP